MQRFVTLCLLSSALIFGGVSAFAETTPQKLERLEKDINSLQRKVYRGEIIVPQNLPPSVKAEDKTAGNVRKTDVDAAFENLPMIEQQLAEATNKNEILTHRVDTLEKKLEKLAADIEIRFAALEKAEHERRIREEEEAVRIAKAEALEKEKARLLAAIKKREEETKKAKDEETRLKGQKTPAVVDKPKLAKENKPAESASKPAEVKKPAAEKKTEATKPAESAVKATSTKEVAAKETKETAVKEKEEAKKENKQPEAKTTEKAADAVQAQPASTPAPAPVIKAINQPVTEKKAEAPKPAESVAKSATESEKSDKSSKPAVLVPAASNAGDKNSKAEKSYKQAYELVKNKEYVEAEAALVAFMNDYPNSDLLPNALYWLGETYYARKDFDMAARTFRSCYRNYPKSAKAEDSLLKLGLSHKSLRNNKEACYVFKNFADIYPNANADLKSRAAKEAENLQCK